MKNIEGLLSDPLQVNSFLNLYNLMIEKVVPKIRKVAFNIMLEHEKYNTYIYDKKNYHQQKVDLKTINSASTETISKHIISGSGQAPVVVLDIQGNTNKWNLIKGIRNGWGDDTKRILLHWKGQWHQLTKEQIFSNYFEVTIK